MVVDLDAADDDVIAGVPPPDSGPRTHDDPRGIGADDVVRLIGPGGDPPCRPKRRRNAKVGTGSKVADQMVL